MARRTRKGERNNAAMQPALFPSARLSVRDLNFIERYMLHGNAARAARETGSPEKNSAQIARGFLEKTLVRQEVERRRALLRQRFEVSSQRVIEEYARIAFADPREAFDAQGNLLPPQELAEHVAAAIASVETEESSDEKGAPRPGRTRKLKFWGKTDALRDLARILGVFKDSLRHEAGESWQDLLRAMHARERES